MPLALLDRMHRIDAKRSALIVAAACLVAGAAPLSALRVQEVPELRIGTPTLSIGGLTDDERYALSRVVGALPLPEGGLVIADLYAQGLRAYTAAGVHVRTVGGEGEGPGEFERIRGLGRCESERIVAFDLSWTRNVYDYELEWLGQYPAEIPSPGQTPYQLACEPSGHIVVTGWGDFRAHFRPGYHVATAPVLLLWDGQVVHDFGERLSSERVGTVRASGEPSGSGPHPFGRQTSVAISTDRVYLGDASEYLVEVYDLRGNRLPDIRWSGPPRAIEPRHYDLYLQDLLDGLDDVSRAGVRRAIRDLPRLEAFPAYDELRVDAGGALWVRAFPRPGEARVEWRVFDPVGGALARLTIPASWALLDIGDEHVVYVERDELDVETVHLAPLVRTAR